MNGWFAAAAIVSGLIAPQGDARRAARLDALRLQVSLDRAGFSVGEIDGRFGAKTRKALQAFQQARGLSVSDAPDEATWTALDHMQDRAPLPPTIEYVVTAEDAHGPFVARIPRDPTKQGQLPQLGYTSIVEMLAERFHASPALLRRLNAGTKTTYAPGSRLIVPNVEPLVPPQGGGRRRGPPAAGADATAAKGTSRTAQSRSCSGANQADTRSINSIRPAGSRTTTRTSIATQTA